MHSIPDPSHVRFTGPLTRFASGLAEELVLLGYTATSATEGCGRCPRSHRPQRCSRSHRPQRHCGQDVYRHPDQHGWW